VPLHECHRQKKGVRRAVEKKGGKAKDYQRDLIVVGGRGTEKETGPAPPKREWCRGDKGGKSRYVKNRGCPRKSRLKQKFTSSGQNGPSGERGKKKGRGEKGRGIAGGEAVGQGFSFEERKKGPAGGGHKSGKAVRKSGGGKKR